MKLTQARLKTLFDYNPDTGLFTRIVDKGSRKAGEIAGGKNGNGYLDICVDGKKYKTHRLVFLYMEGYLPENDVDHINRDRADNRWCNLREVSARCNARNVGLSKRNKSGVIGVCWDKTKNKWRVDIKGDKGKERLGRFENFEHAVKARWEAEVKHNFPNCNSTSTAYLYLNNVSINVV